MSYIIAQDGSNNYLMNCGSDIFSKSQWNLEFQTLIYIAECIAHGNQPGPRITQEIQVRILTPQLIFFIMAFFISFNCSCNYYSMKT